MDVSAVSPQIVIAAEHFELARKVRAAAAENFLTLPIWRTLPLSASSWVIPEQNDLGRVLDSISSS